MRKGDLLGGFFFLAAGVLFALYALSVDIGTWDEPGPGLLPFWSGMLLSFMSALLIARSLIRRARDHERLSLFAEEGAWKRVSATVAALVCYNALLTTLGFATVTFLFVGFLVKFIFPQRWVTTVVTAGLATAATRLIFVNLLGINFPRGVLGF